MHRVLSIVVSVLLLLTANGPLAAADSKAPKSGANAAAIPAEAKATLEAAGVKIMTGQKTTSWRLTLPEEDDLAKSRRELAKIKKAMAAADREVYVAQQNVDELKDQIRELKLRHTKLSADLSKVFDSLSNNRIVGELNAIAGQVDELNTQVSESDERLQEAHKQAATVRDEFVRELTAMRASADEAARKWKELAADNAVKQAVEALNQAVGTNLTVGPSASLATSVKALEAMEKSVASEAIKLDNQSNSLWVSVTINGKHQQRLIVDSGATIVSLPAKMARDMAIEPGSSGEPIEVGLADGRKVPGVRIKLASVRVGSFTVEDVECCILGPEATDAPALLGMSFLGQFKFEVDAKRSELRLLKVDSGEPAPAPKQGSKGKKRPTKKK